MPIVSIGSWSASALLGALRAGRSGGRRAIPVGRSVPLLVSELKGEREAEHPYHGAVFLQVSYPLFAIPVLQLLDFAVPILFCTKTLGEMGAMTLARKPILQLLNGDVAFKAFRV